jgi:hypothetical protein
VVSAEKSKGAGGDVAGISGPESLSQLLARILDQLSVGAWLPAAALVFLFLLIGELRAEGGDIHSAVAALGSLSIAAVALLLGAVIMATMLTQAFAFEGIRFFEGYWGHWRIGMRLADIRCRRFASKRDRLIARLKTSRGAAIEEALRRMQASPIPRPIVHYIRDQLQPPPGGPPADVDLAAEAANFPWEEYASACDLRRMASLLAAIKEYPVAYALVQPTRLGNTMRAYEERAFDLTAGVDPEAYVEGVYHDLPRSMQIDHDQVRSRLDLYTSLIVVFALSGLVAVVVLARANNWLAVTLALTASILGGLSYRAAIATARAYGSMLSTIVAFKDSDPSDAESVAARKAV